MLSKNRVGKLVAATILVGVAGCNSGTEIPLAKVAPVTVTAPPPPKALPKGAIASPSNINAPPGTR